MFLNLTTFSQTGGIEKFNRSFLKAIYEIENTGKVYSNSHSLYDTSVDNRYYPNEKYTGYGKNKFRFIYQSLLKAKRFDSIILGHINLAVIGCILKILMPKKEIILIIHGVEVWEGISRVKRFVIEHANKILSVSEFTQQKMMEVKNIKNKSIIIFPNTIDPFFQIKANSQFVPIRKKYGIGESDFVMFTLTRLSSSDKYKGYDIVLKCLPYIQKKYSNIKYVIAGKYDKQEKERVDRIISDLNLHNNVFLLGFINEEEIVQHYHMGDLFIMPSQKEGFGIVFIEAMACGIPVIAGNIDGSVDALRNGELGTLVNPESTDEITQAIINVIENKEKYNGFNVGDLQQRSLAYFGFTQFKKRLENVLTTPN